jgi:hypothetical protein
VTKQCRWCSGPFQTRKAQQQCCSLACRNCYRWARTDPARRQAQSAKMIAARRAKGWKSIGGKLKTCKTLGEAYRLGHKNGYTAGYERARRLREGRAA